MFTTEDGLVRNWITRIYRDAQGFLWFCTVEGVSIFDGQHFTNFTSRDGLPSRFVNDVVETSSGEYWLATGSGLARLSLRHAVDAPAFTTFKLGASDAANRIDRLVEDSKHQIWCITADGLYHFSTITTQLFHAEKVALPEPIGTQLSDLLIDSNNRLWLLSSSSLVMRAEDGTWKTSTAVAGLLEEANALTQDSAGRIWIGCRDSLLGIRVDQGGSAQIVGRYSGLAGGGPITALIADPQNDLWVGARLLVRFHPATSKSVRSRQTIPVQSPLLPLFPNGLSVDREGNIWVGVGNSGVARICRRSSELFGAEEGFVLPAVIGVTAGINGNIFAITSDRTLHEFVNGRFVPRPRVIPANATITGWGQDQVVLQDRAGHWWFASGQGVLCYPPTKDSRALAHLVPRVYTHRDGLPDDTILRLYQDSHGVIWAGTAQGIAKFDPAAHRWIRLNWSNDPAHLSGAVHTITEDQKGSLWVGLASPRILRICGSRVETIAGSELRGFTNALLVDHAGRLWVGTSQNGLLRLDDVGTVKPRFVRPAMRRNLSSDHIFSLAEDKWGRIYIACGRGVERLNPETGALEHFSTENGLPGGETERLHRDSAGNIWFASNSGVARYQPEIESHDTPNPPLLRSIRINGQDQPVSILGETSVSDLELTPRQTNIEIEYRSLNFDLTTHPRYRYRLGDASTAWSTPIELERVSYANLAPGFYRFEVRSTNEGGVESAPARFSFRLLAPVWQRPWFISIVALLLAVAAHRLYRYRLHQLLAVERVRHRLASDLHDDLGAGLAEIAITSEVAKRRPWERDALDQIAQRARGLRAVLSDIVWTVDPQGDHLAELLRKMRQTAFDLLEQDDRRVAFHAPEDKIAQKIELAPETRQHLLLFFKEAIANAARHSHATDVAIDLSIVGKALLLEIRDNGCGFDPNPSPGGHGMKALQYRAKQLNAPFQLETSPGHGVTIRLQVSFS
jgi:ligand-binding sensor domain-containing protein/signal transduction histidine kinase